VRVALNGLFLGRTDGTGRYTHGLIESSAALDGPCWELLALGGMRADPRTVGQAGYHELRPPSVLRGENLAKLWFEQRGAPVAAQRLGADLLHYPYFAAPASTPLPLVVTIHDLIPLVLPQYRGSGTVRAYMQLQAATARRAALILTDSNASRHDVVRVLGIPRQRVRVIHLAVDSHWRPVGEDAAAAVRAKHRLPERFILYMGGLDVRKNVERLILAYARARASHGVSEPLAITGNPDRRGTIFPPLRPLVEQLGIERQVRFLGYVADEDQPALYSACTLAVYPSRYEGFGLPVLEAMACGAPVVCSNASSIPEVAGDAALTFDPDDELAFAEALARGLQDDPLRDELTEKGLARAASFTWEKTAAATLQAYRDVLTPS
jgi:glycosyltransferase involved in cell wall biosynthesis